MRVADYIFQFLAERGVTHVFLVAGGGAMFLNDALRVATGITPVCQHHEQACTFAAEGYARITGRPGVVSVTSGPGGTNALTGVYSAWMDSIPLLVISGQVKQETCMATYPDCHLRQLGDQEADIIALARPVTKYAVLVAEPEEIRYHLERAWHLTSAGRPGPCWLDVPLDVQSAEIVPRRLHGYDPPLVGQAILPVPLKAHCADILARLCTADRPVLLAGSGIRCAGVVETFRALIPRLGIPVVLSRTAVDLLPASDALWCGRAGIDADRAGNLVLQNADALLILGSRLGPRQTGYEWNSFARAAWKAWVNIDDEEFHKHTVPIDRYIHADLRLFLNLIADTLNETQGYPVECELWRAWCRERVNRFPGSMPARNEAPGGPLNPYRFLKEAFAQFAEDEVIVCGNGASFIMAAHVAQLLPNQRLFFNSGCAAMGYDLPAAIGAAFAHQNRVICFAGDGSLMMNLQEMQTLVHHHVPVKLFILDNRGYLSIRTTQRSYFAGYIGESPASGVSFPEFTRVAAAFGIPTRSIAADDDIATVVKDVLADPGPVVCNVILDPEQSFEPRISSRVLPDGRLISPSLEDMYPFLSREELKENMIVPLIE